MVMTWTMKWRTPWWHEKQPASQSSKGYHPKRRCLRQWHAVLGARTEKDAWKVSPFETHSFNRLVWHHDTLFLCDGDNHRIVSWKAGETTFLSVAGEGAAVTGFNQLSGSPLLWWEISTHSFQNTVGKLVLETRWIHDLCCSPNGTFYVLQADGRRVQRLADSKLIPVISSEQLPKDQQFVGWTIRVSKEEVLFHPSFNSLRSHSSFQLPWIVVVWIVFYRPIFCNSRWTILRPKKVVADGRF